MQKKIIVGIAVVATLVVSIVLVGRLMKAPESERPEYLWAGPIKLKYNPHLNPGVIAALDGREITEADLLSRSKLLEELATQEVGLVLDAVQKKLGPAATAGAEIVLFRPKPAEDYSANLPQSAQVKITFSPRRSDESLASINGELVNRKDLGLNQVRFTEIKNAQLTETLSLLKGMFLRQLLLKKAKAAGTDIEGLIKANIIKEDIPVQDEEVDRFAQEHDMTPGTKDKSLRDRLRAIISDKRRSAAIDEYAKVQFAGELGEIGIRGTDFIIPLSETQALIEQKQDKRPTTTVFVFANFLCGSCGKLIESITALRGEFKDSIRVGFIHLFPNGDWKSKLLAESAQCLSRQKHEYFWSFSSQVVREGSAIDERKIYEIVKTVGADFPGFQSCLLKQTYKQVVEEHLKYAADLGVSTVPTIIIGEHVLTGVTSRQEIAEILRTKTSQSNSKGLSGWIRNLLTKN